MCDDGWQAILVRAKYILRRLLVNYGEYLYANLTCIVFTATLTIKPIKYCFIQGVRRRGGTHAKTYSNTHKKRLLV